jgi:endonuclease/exonuclease/phosphatase family metal-dependent hydrolase
MYLFLMEINDNLNNESDKRDDYIKFLTYNVHGFNSKNMVCTFDMILEQIKSINPDIFGLQEIHFGCPSASAR